MMTKNGKWKTNKGFLMLYGRWHLHLQRYMENQCVSFVRRPLMCSSEQICNNTMTIFIRNSDSCPPVSELIKYAPCWMAFVHRSLCFTTLWKIHCYWGLVQNHLEQKAKKPITKRVSEKYFLGLRQITLCWMLKQGLHNQANIKAASIWLNYSQVCGIMF